MKKRVLVYPCGTEIGLEINASLKYSKFYEVYGGSCSYDHGQFELKKHISDLPFIKDDSSEEDIIKFNEAIRQYEFDFIFPAMDGVVTVFSKFRELLTPIVIAPEYATTSITRSKRRTYQVFNNIIPVPKIYDSLEMVEEYPVFVKPDVGQGSIGTLKINSKEEIKKIDWKNNVIMEYLPGKEYTIDCFTNLNGDLVYVQGRERRRIKNGISVNTVLCKKQEFIDLAIKINELLSQKGAWFFQIKEADDGKYKLLEIASRLAGASAIQRCMGVNLPLLTIDTYAGINIEEVIIHSNKIEVDRSLKNCYRTDFHYKVVYLDYDDNLIIDGKVNTQMISFIYQCISNEVKVVLLSKHDGDLITDMNHCRLNPGLFDEIVHISQEEEKAEYIKEKDAIFIDDSYGERKKVYEKCGIEVFDTAAIECLMEM